MPEIYGHKVHTKKLSTNIDAFQKVFENENLSKKDYKVFGFLCCRLESEHYKKIDKKQIAESLHLDKKDVEKSIETLEEELIIAQGSDEHVRNGYRFTYADREGGSKLSRIMNKG